MIRSKNQHLVNLLKILFKWHKNKLTIFLAKIPTLVKLLIFNLLMVLAKEINQINSIFSIWTLRMSYSKYVYTFLELMFILIKQEKLKQSVEKKLLSIKKTIRFKQSTFYFFDNLPLSSGLVLHNCINTWVFIPMAFLIEYE